MIKKVLRSGFKVFIRKIPTIDKIAMFRELGVSLGVHSFTCNGNLGVFEGSIYDRIVHGFYLQRNNWAPGLQSILERIFLDGSGTYIDVGANIGLTTIPIAQKKDIKCFAFEPEINNYFYLCKNIIANSVESKVKAFNVALFSDDCTLEMELSDINSGDHRVRMEHQNGLNACQYNELSRETIKVSARKLDNVLMPDNLIKPVVMKVDTQGSEVRVFQGAEKCLKLVDYLIVEYWPYGLLRFEDPAEAFISVISQFHYGAVYNDSEANIPELRPVDELIKVISGIPQNDVNIEHIDIVLSRHKSFSGGEN